MNRALHPLEPLAGEWEVEIRWSPKTHALVGGPPAVRSRNRFEWIENGRFLVLRQGGDDGPPQATLAMGRDDGGEEYCVLYADARGVSRVYRMSFHDRIWRMWRDAPGFSQRFEGRLSDDGRTLEAHWDKSIDGHTWERDFDLTYTRS